MTVTPPPIDNWNPSGDLDGTFAEQRGPAWDEHLGGSFSMLKADAGLDPGAPLPDAGDPPK